MIIDTCSTSEYKDESVKVLDTEKSSAQFLNIYATMLQALMNVSRKPLFMIGGLFIFPQSVMESLDRKIPYLLIGCHQINKPGFPTPKNLSDAFDNVMD